MNSYKLIENKKQIEELRVACILDDFSDLCFEGIFKKINISPDSWQKEMKENNVDIFFVESAWYGINNQWKDMIGNRYGRENPLLRDIIIWCKKNNIPTIFWNKEDPINYDFFIGNVKLFDYVFTSDFNSIEKYKKELSHDNIYTLSFACNPLIHNPIRKDNNKKEKSFFAGTYYRFRFEERNKDLKKLLDLAIEYTGLDIYDRHYNSDTAIYRFPDKYKEYIKGYLPSYDMYETYKLYKIALNVNCVKNSPSMFSRRVYECLASGVPVISTYSLGIKEIFNNLVVSSDNIEELREEFIRLREEKYYYDKMVAGMREVLTNHTYYKRFLFILEKIGMEVDVTDIKIAVIIKTDNMEEYKILKKEYLNQRYENKKLYVITDNKDLENMIENEEENIEVIFKCVKINTYLVDDFISEDYISFFSLNNKYKAYYLQDLINTRLYADEKIIGKKSYYEFTKDENYKLINKDMDFKYVDEIDFDKCIVKKEILSKKTIYKVLKYMEKNRISNLSCSCFSADNLNLICNKK